MRRVTERLKVGVLLLLAATGCEGRTERPSVPHTTLNKPMIPKHYRPLFEGGISEGKAKTLLELLPFKTITLSRTECFGSCPVYDLTLHSDGRAELKAVSGLDKTGDFEGTVNLFSYGKLCYLMEQLRFTEFNPRYDGNWPDAATVIVTASTGAKEFSVSDYSEIGPIELWAIQQTIDNIRHEIPWRQLDNGAKPAAK